MYLNISNWHEHLETIYDISDINLTTTIQNLFPPVLLDLLT